MVNILYSFQSMIEEGYFEGLISQHLTLFMMSILERAVIFFSLNGVHGYIVQHWQYWSLHYDPRFSI